MGIFGSCYSACHSDCYNIISSDIYPALTMSKAICWVLYMPLTHFILLSTRRRVQQIALFYHWGNWGTDKLTISKVTGEVTVELGLDRDLPDPQSLTQPGGQQMEHGRSLRIVENRDSSQQSWRWMSGGEVLRCQTTGFMSLLCPFLEVWPGLGHPTSLCLPTLTIKWALRVYSESPELVLFWFSLLK